MRMSGKYVSGVGGVGGVNVNYLGVQMELRYSFFWISVIPG